MRRPSTGMRKLIRAGVLLRTVLWTTLLVLLLAPLRTDARQQPKRFAHPGPRGIFLVLGTEPLSPSKPIKNAVLYRIERRKGGGTSWERLADIQGPASYSEFESRLTESVKIFAEQFMLSDIPANVIWDRFAQTGSVDSLGVWSRPLAVRLALGVMYYDMTAAAKTLYEYRVSRVNSSDAPIQSMVSGAITYPLPVRLARLSLRENQQSDVSILLRWAVGKGERPSAFSVYRQSGLAGAYSQIRPVQYMTIQKDVALFVVQDTLLQPGQFYRYYLLPRDYFGNVGPPSDTAFAAAYNFRAVPLPDNIGTSNLDSLGGIRITWRLRDPSLVRSVRIYRSGDYNSGFGQVAEVQSMETSYDDRTAVPMKEYYYYLVMTGPLGEMSAPSAKVAGLFQSALPPQAPTGLEARGIKGGVRLQWLRSDEHIKGYYVYRSDGQEPSLEIVSPLIPARDPVAAYSDTARALSGKRTYAYAVRAENTSHVLSDFSDTVFVRPPLPTQPQTPLEVTAYAEGRRAQLYWKNMYESDETVDGYVVYRREPGATGKNASFAAITDTLLPAIQSRYTDTTLVEGVAYEYAVQSVDMFGGKSGLSNAVRIDVSVQMPVPPSGIRAMGTSQGVLVQWDVTLQPNLASYRVYRYQRGEKPVLVGTVKPGGSLEFVDSTAKKGNLYFYFITTLDAKKRESVPSREVGIRP